MMKRALLFPGQGSQYVGMGKDHFDSNAEFAELCNNANQILGIDLTKIMFEGPDEKLKQTEFTQPAIFLHSVGLFRMMDIKPDMVAGHSLGEFSSLVACDALKFEDALLIVRRRGQLMQKAGSENPGTMAAVIGLDDDTVSQICEHVEKETGDAVVAANFNSPGQVVISGYEKAIDAAIEKLKEAGCRLAKKLPVSGAFHSELMQPALDGLREGLEKLDIKEPFCPVYSNYTGKPTAKPDKIRENLLQQLLNPVRWTQTLQNMKKDGAGTFIEMGPGKVLQGLVKRTLNDVEIAGYQ